MMNVFKRLRFKDKLSDTPELTQQEVAEKLGITKGAVSKIEKSGKANMDTLELYHKAFNVPYDYLMGKTATQDIKYHALGELFPFDDTFYKNLERLVELDKGNHFVEYMLSALLKDPGALFTALITVFDTLYQINNIQQDKGLSPSAKAEMSKMQEYIFSQSMIGFFENSIMPLLGNAFKDKEAYLTSEAKDTEEIFRNWDYGPESVTAENITVTPIKDNDKE